MSSRRSRSSSLLDSLAQIRITVFLLGCLVLCASTAWSQRAADVTGTVTDSTGAAVPGVQVDATNTLTGVKVSAVTNDAGLYRFVELVIGPYQIEGSKAGFKTSATNVTLEAGRTTTVDIKLELGQVTTRVEVQATAPTIDTQSQTVSNVVETKIIETIPVALRRPLQLLTLAAAVTYGGTEPTTTQTPFFSVAGGFTQPAAYMDGANATNTRAESNVLTINPSIETTAEFSMVENGYKAEYGGSGTGLVLMTTKSGTNQFHGAAWDFLRNQAMDARNWFATQPAPFKENIYGVAVGGPIKKDKLFFFANYEGTRSTIENLSGAGRGLTAEFHETHPTAAMMQGDFSQLFNLNGTLRQIYNPYSAHLVNGQLVRDPFPGNVIPQNMLSPIALKVLAHEPLPNTAPIDITGTNNFISTRSTNGVRRNSVVSRIDYNKSDKNKFFYRLFYDKAPWQYDGPWSADPSASSLVSKIRDGAGNLSTRNPFDPGDFEVPVWSKSHTAGWTHIFSPTVINDLHFAYNTRSWAAHHSSEGIIDPTELFGLQFPDPVQKTEIHGDKNIGMPNFNVTRYTMPGNGWTGTGDYQLPMRDWEAIESLTWVKSSHQFKLGYEGRWSAGTMYSDLNWPGNFNFNGNGTASTPGDATSGDAMADFLVDWPSSGNYKSVNLRHFWEFWHSFYAQDDWKVSSKLTLNIGLRYEYDTAMREGLNSSQCAKWYSAPYDWNKCKDRIIGVDLKAINPVSGTPGVITFPKTYYDPYNRALAPRLGFAYSIRSGTVIRGGWGMFYSYPIQWGLRGAPGDVRPDAATVGDFTSPDNGITAPFHMSTGMPSPAPFTPDLLNPGFGSAPIGQRTILSPSVIDRNLHTPYSVQWNLNVQHQFRNGLFVEVGGIGNHGHSIFSNLNLEQMRIQDVQRIAGTEFPVVDPYRLPTNADRPYPQFTGFTYGTWYGNSSYNALIIKVEKRYGNGLSFISNYTYSSYLDNVGPNDIYNINATKGPSSNMRPQTLNFGGLYELPFGRGKRYLAEGALGKIVGGWSIAPQFFAQSGALLTPSASPNQCFCGSTARPDRLAGASVQGQKTISSWFNTAAFAYPAPFTFGNSGKGVIAGPGVWNLDTSLARKIAFTERYALEVRGEFFNLFNHPNWGNPSTTIFPASAPGTTNIITSARDPRRVQLGLRLSF